jgi:predicted dehydrogenase
MYSKTVDRRSFLKQSAGLAAGIIGFPYVIRSSALGKAGTVAPSNRLTLAQIGCGGMGGSNLNAFLNRRQQIQVIAVCDVDDRHALEKKRMVDNKYGNEDCKSYRDFREMIDTESIDIVSQALPDHLHAAASVMCARKGIDMYGEKPFARTIGEGRIMCDVMKQYGTIWQTGSWQRSQEKFRFASELVRNGRIGKVHHVEVGLPNGEGPDSPQPDVTARPDYIDYDLWLGPAPWKPYQNLHAVRESNQAKRGLHYNWRHIFDYSGGKLTDWGGHHIDIAHWGLGLDYTGPVAVEGRGKYPRTGIYDVAYDYDFVCTYADGVTLRVANLSNLPHGQGVCWYGDNGWLFVSRSQMKASNPAILREKIGPDEIRLYQSQDHFQNFLDCVKTRRQTVTPPEIAHRSISVAFLGEIAMLTECQLKWDPVRERFVDNEKANNYLMRSYRSPWRL